MLALVTKPSIGKLPQGKFKLDSREHWGNLVSCMFILTSVCVAWRKATHATPRLWSTIDISLEGVQLGLDFAWVEDWINQSQSLGLNLHLDFFLDSDEFSDIGKNFLEYVLMHFSHKVQLLDFKGHLSWFLPILNLIPSTLFFLEELYLSISGTYGMHHITFNDLVHLPPQKTKVLLGAPKLQQVAFNRGYLLDHLALLAEQLMSLKISDKETYFDTNMFVGLLPQFHQLVSLEIQLPSGSLLEPISRVTTRPPILLPKVKLLKVYNVYEADKNMLCCITTLVLELLAIGCHDKIDLDILVIDMT